MKKIKITIILLLVVKWTSAQHNLTLYNMKSVPQRMAINPALTPNCKWYFGTPALSSIDFTFNSKVLGFGEISDVIVPNGANYTFDATKLSSVFSNGLSFNTGLNQEWLNIGFRIRKSMFTLSVNEKVKTRFLMHQDYFKLFLEGNGGPNIGHEFDLAFGLDILHTREFALGFSRSFLSDKLRLGVRGKYVLGLNAIQTAQNDLTFTTSEKAFTFNVASDIKINSSFIEIDTNNLVSSILFSNRNNSGFGLDLGAEYKLNKKISLSASILDLGVVKWETNAQSSSSKNPGAVFEYSGVDVQNFFADSTGKTTGFEALKDTLEEVLGLNTKDEQFTTGLLGEFYVGGNFHLTDNHNIGALMYGSFYQKKFYPALTLSWNSQFGKILGLSASYTVFNGSFVNLGLGAAMKLGPEQFYIATDNALGSVTDNTRNLGVHFGWNHTFGKKKESER